MIRQITYKTFFLLLFSLVVLPPDGIAQSVSSYRIEGNEVVFMFDIRQYAKELKDKNSEHVDFKDLDIYEVAVSGQFNDWSKQGWKMLKKGEFVFELRKPLDAFNEAFPLEFKYIINGKYISGPADKSSDSRQFTDDFLEEVYRLDLSTIKIHDQGKVVFFLKGQPNAEKVILSGSFNGWDEQAIQMQRVPEGWELRADLPPGRYEYKFIVDGEWTHDKANKEMVVNEHNTLNSVLYISVPVKFTLESFPNAKQVILTGSFNDWNEQQLKMRKENGAWNITIPVAGGKHHYKFIIDGQWHTDPSNPIIENDGYGNLNSVLFVH